MRNPLLILLLLTMLVTGTNCMKDKTCSPNPPSSEAAQIQNYAAANSIAAVPHNSGLYYEIINPGNGATPSLNSKIVITYTARFVSSGTVFDERTNPNNTATEGPESPWPLSQLIEGWRVGLPLIQEGGHIRLLVPSAMAYGCTGYGAIPANTILDFDITLVDVQ